MVAAELVQAVSKQSKSVVIRLTNDRIILTADETTLSKYRYWCTIRCSSMFSSFEMEGVQDTGQIQIEANAVALSKALKLVSSSSKSLSVRLSKSNGPGAGQPVLNVVIEEPCLNTHKYREICHNIPIFIMSRRLWDDYDKVDFPVQIKFDVQNTAEFAATVRRMRQLHRGINISLNTSVTQAAGSTRTVRTMTIRSLTQGLRIKTTFRNVRLSADRSGLVSDEPPADPNCVQIDVDARLVHQFLNAFKKKAGFLTIGIKENKWLTFQMTEETFTMDYAIPTLLCGTM